MAVVQAFVEVYSEEEEEDEGEEEEMAWTKEMGRTRKMATTTKVEADPVQQLAMLVRGKGAPGAQSSVPAPAAEVREEGEVLKKPKVLFPDGVYVSARLRSYLEALDEPTVVLGDSRSQRRHAVLKVRTVWGGATTLSHPS
jgi:hypothetical protein